MPADMFTHSGDGRQPAPEGPFARTRPILVDGDDRDGGADVLVRRHNPTTTRPRRRGGDDRVTHPKVKGAWIRPSRSGGCGCQQGEVAILAAVRRGE